MGYQATNNETRSQLTSKLRQLAVKVLAAQDVRLGRLDMRLLIS